MTDAALREEGAGSRPGRGALFFCLIVLAALFLTPTLA